MTIAFFIVILVALVWVHELGHFGAAKLFGIRVDEFAIGFPPRLLTVQWGETRYSFNLLLLGGYVSIYGEDGDGATDPRAFNNKSRWTQAAVVVAGIVSNIIFAWLLLSAGYMHGLPSAIEHTGWGTVRNARPTIDAVLPGSPAEKAGLKYNDVVEEVQTAHDDFNLRTLNTDHQADSVHNFLTSHVDDSVVITILRDGEEKTFVTRAQDGVVDGRKAIGIELDDIGILKLPPQTAVLQGGLVGWQLLSAEAEGLWGFITQAFRGAADVGQLSGPIGIVAVGSQFVGQGFGGIITITALISLNLALINIIPIPGLDGGRLLFVAIEGVLRRPISPRLASTLTIAGFALLVALMLVVSIHDVQKLVG